MSVSETEEETLSMQEAVKEATEKEEEAIAVLGAGDENNCTYPLGYVDRQALFSCVTCDPLHENPSGVCYACSLHCHDGHDLVELYTKRNFRCDCGNSKFGDLKCELEEKKDDVNEKNKYNQNFKETYCTCKRTYPDPEDKVEDEMIQCILCEDWFHSRHLGSLSPSTYSEMICDGCVKEHSFLYYYKDFSVAPSTLVKKCDTNDNVDVITTASVEPTQNQNASIASVTCKLQQYQSKHLQVKSEDIKVMFMMEGWREKLCQCEECLNTYKEKEIGFLISNTDTITFYEQKGKENVEQMWEQAASHISQMNQVQQVELMHGFNDLKAGLTEFLSGFKENQVVRKEDVEGFFEQLNRRKRMRLETGEGVPPDTCKY